MDASSQKLLPFYTCETNDPIIDLPLEISPYIFISEREYLGLKNLVGYWQAMHKKAISREQKFKQKIMEQEGQIRDLRNRIFGKKSEKKSSSNDNGKPKSDEPKRHRGQQAGSEGHGLTERPDLPERKETICFPEHPICPECNKPYIFDKSMDIKTTIIEVEVKAYVRKIIRPCMKKGCSCKSILLQSQRPYLPGSCRKVHMGFRSGYQSC